MVSSGKIELSKKEILKDEVKGVYFFKNLFPNHILTEEDIISRRPKIELHQINISK